MPHLFIFLIPTFPQLTILAAPPVSANSQGEHSKPKAKWLELMISTHLTWADIQYSLLWWGWGTPGAAQQSAEEDIQWGAAVRTCDSLPSYQSSQVTLLGTTPLRHLTTAGFLCALQDGRWRCHESFHNFRRGPLPRTFSLFLVKSPLALSQERIHVLKPYDKHYKQAFKHMK